MREKETLVECSDTCPYRCARERVCVPIGFNEVCDIDDHTDGLTTWDWLSCNEVASSRSTSKNRASSRLNTLSACFDVSWRACWSDNAIRCVRNNERAFDEKFSLPWLSEGRSNMVWSTKRLTVYFADTLRFFLSFTPTAMNEMMNLDYTLASIDSIYLQRKEIVRRRRREAKKANELWMKEQFIVLDSMFYYEPTSEEERKRNRRTGE